MLRSWKLGTAFGIGIYVHWSFFLLPAWLLFANLSLGGPVAALFAVAVVLAVFGCVVLHELGHALTARRFGIPTLDITLYPIGGVARLERMSERPWQEFWIAVAGPAVNVLIAGLLAGALAVAPLFAGVVMLPRLGVVFLNQLMWLNLLLAGFNLLPAFPMDGGRVLRSLLSLRLGQLRATQIAVNVGTFLALVMGLAGAGLLPIPGLSGSLMVILVAVFTVLAGQQELAAVHQREWLRRQQAPFVNEEAEVARRPSDVTVYLWDSARGTWVPQRPLRPVRRYGMGWE